jgi:DNA processing protein
LFLARDAGASGPFRVTRPELRPAEVRRQAENKGETTSALSAGTNALLRHGAAPALSVDDVLEAIGVVAATEVRPSPAGAAGTLLAALRQAPATADELARIAALPAGEVAALLTELELEGLVEPGDGAYRATIAR